MHRLRCLPVADSDFFFALHMGEHVDECLEFFGPPHTTHTVRAFRSVARLSSAHFLEQVIILAPCLTLYFLTLHLDSNSTPQFLHLFHTGGLP